MIFIGDAYMAIGQDEKGIESWHKAIQIDDTRREPWLRLADYYWRKNNPQRVACYCMAALEIPPNDCYCNVGAHYTFEPHEKLYWALWWLGQRERSKEHWKKALAYDPNNPKYIADRQFYETVNYDYKMPEKEIEGWMTRGELEWLYHQAQKVDSILELGSWKGRSSHALLSGCKGTVTCVDTWKGSVDPRDMTNSMAKQEDIFATFKNNVGHFKNLEPCQMESSEAAAKFAAEGRTFDMVFIDAGHTYEEVKRDIELWRPLAKVVLSGHDYLPQTWMGVCQAVDEMVPNTAKAESIWYKELTTVPVEKPKKVEVVERIPKRLFTIWLSDNPELPPSIEKCVASQRAVSGYEHTVLGLKDLPEGIPYLDAAIAAKKWVKASDYLRIHELIERGGIHLDADVEILPGKNFDDMLGASLFAGREENRFISTAVIGAAPGHPLLKAHLEEVVAKFKGDDDKNFESSLEIITPRIYAEAAADSTIQVYPPEFFYPYNHQTGIINVTADTRTFHHFLKSWTTGPQSEDFLPRVAVLIPTLGRPEGLKRCLESISRLYYPKHLVRVVVDADEDATVPVKVNQMARDNRDWADAFAYVGNDVEFSDPYCLYCAAVASVNHGLVTFNSGPLYPDNGNACEHFLITKGLVDKLGEIFCERMYHVGVDNLLFFKASRLGQAKRCEEAKITHYHFSKGEPMDWVYEKGWSQVDLDRKILAEEIEKAKIDFPTSS
jgi:tetratricopeptide (TPR) repeat protein